jgi:hypothetical protein
MECLGSCEVQIIDISKGPLEWQTDSWGTCNGGLHVKSSAGYRDLAEHR